MAVYLFLPCLIALQIRGHPLCIIPELPVAAMEM